MAQPIVELETILKQLVAEHRRMLDCVEQHQLAMQALDLAKMKSTGEIQEQTRSRIILLDARRQAVVLQIARGLKLDSKVSLPRLAELHPERSQALLQLRGELKSVANNVATKSLIAARLANAVLGHLNTAVRLLAGAVGRAGTYGRDGSPRVGQRIGIMEAVG